MTQPRPHRAGNPRVRRLVEQPPASLLVRQHPTSRVRSHLLRSARASGPPGRNAMNRVSIKPGAPHHAKDIGTRIARRSTEHGSRLGVHRWVVEQTIALLHWFRRLRIRWEIRDDIHVTGGRILTL